MKVYTLGEEAQVLMEDVVDAYVARVSPAGGMHMSRRKIHLHRLSRRYVSVFQLPMTMYFLKGTAIEKR